MGSCASCCRRKRKIVDEERRPLLSSSSDSLRPPRTPLEYLADILAAFHAGKLPTQTQLELALLRLKYSGALNLNTDTAAVNRYVAGEELQKVLDDVNSVLDVVVTLGKEKNYDNRMQDLIFNTRKLSKPYKVAAHGEVRVDASTSGIETFASAIPSPDEVALDAAALVSSLRDIALLVLTSSAFRLILSDLLNTARDFVAYGAERVKAAATVVENVAEAVEADMRSAETVDRDIQLQHESHSRPISVKETLLGRIELILRQAQSSPKHNAALRTLLFLFRKYALRLEIAADALSQTLNETNENTNIEISLPAIIPEPRFSRVMVDLKVLVERLAGGHSLNPILSTLSELVSLLSETADDRLSSEGQHFFDEAGEWLDRALRDNQFASSPAGRASAAKLFDDGQNLISQDAGFSSKCNELMEELDKFRKAVVSDQSIVALVNVLDTLQRDVALLFEETGNRGRRVARHWRATLISTFIGWLLPHILRLIHIIPLPRVEYVQRRGDLMQLAVALDALILEAEEALLPDVFQFQEWAEVRVELDERLGAAELTNPNVRLIQENGIPQSYPSESTPLLASEPGAHASNPSAEMQQRRKQTRVHSTSRIRIHIEGLRLTIRDVGYYALYNATRWLGYADEGIVSAEIGRSGERGEGLSLDIELEIDSDAYGSKNTEETASRPLYRIIDVRTALPGLTLRLSNSRHYIFNAVLSSLVGPIGRLVAPRILNSQIRIALEKLEEGLRGLKVSAESKAAERNDKLPDEANKEDVGWTEWWSAVLERFGKEGEGLEENEEENGDDDPETDTYTESTTKIGLKGVVHHSVVQPEPDPQGEVPSTEESSFAVGLGAQLLPGHGEPADVHRVAPSDIKTAAREEVREVRDTMQDRAEGLDNIGEQGLKTAMDTRRELEEAERRLEARSAVERRRRGWRSRAFDLT